MAQLHLTPTAALPVRLAQLRPCHIAIKFQG